MESEGHRARAPAGRASAAVLARTREPPSLHRGSADFCAAGDCFKKTDAFTSHLGLNRDLSNLPHVLFAWLLVSEVPTAEEALGGAVIGGALWLAASGGQGGDHAGNKAL